MSLLVATERQWRLSAMANERRHADAPAAAYLQAIARRPREISDALALG
jgi:hypothetical protein